MCIDEEALNSSVAELMGQFSAAEDRKNKFEQMLRRQFASTAAAAAKKQRITIGPYSRGG